MIAIFFICHIAATCSLTPASSQMSALNALRFDSQRQCHAALDRVTLPAGVEATCRKPRWDGETPTGLYPGCKNDPSCGSLFGWSGG